MPVTSGDSSEDSLALGNNDRVAPIAAIPHRPRKPTVCRFFNSKDGCRAGANCRFYHPPKATKPSEPSESDLRTGLESASVPAPAAESSRTVYALPEQGRVVSRPTPRAQTEDPRAFQIGQVQRRFKPEVTSGDEASTFIFGLKPSDPDFPYEIDTLQCILTVPKSYPTHGRPKLQVTNNDIPRGFQINIERGFDVIAASNPEATLLGLINRLDRQLEPILAGRIAETVKLVANRGPALTAPEAKRVTAPEQQPKAIAAPRAELTRPTEEQIRAAEAKRQSHTRQLEARFGRLQSYSKSGNGLTYTLPLDSPKKAKWPVALRGLKTFDLHVPRLYPLEAATISLGVKSAEGSSVEQAFEQLPTSMQSPTLTQLANHLTQHLAEMAIDKGAATSREHTASAEPATEIIAPAEEDVSAKAAVSPSQTWMTDDKQHIHHIPRPPEWTPRQDDVDDGASESSSLGSDTSDGEDDAEPEDVHTSQTASSSAPQERGVLLSFPHIEFHGIELLEVTSLNVTVKCERCKHIMDVQRLRNYSENAANLRNETCKKCASILGVGFRTDLIHVNSARAGYLDLDGCAVIDMLPSNFVPTCSECSTPYPAPGVVSVRGDSMFAFCRECHHKMTFRIPEVKFLQVSAAAIRASKATGRRKVKENLGITAGSELPKRGRCKHYSKSYRWFRFSCCAKVFPCDRCHDEQTDHSNEHANRMLCGFCSREQNFRPEDCGICHAVLIGKRGKGFWEGGKGTRDPARMSKKGKALRPGSPLLYQNFRLTSCQIQENTSENQGQSRRRDLRAETNCKCACLQEVQ